MHFAFLLINVQKGAESAVLEKLRKMDAVEEAYRVYGVYDIVAKIRASTMDTLKEMVTWRVRRQHKVESTTTMIVAKKAK